MKKYHIKKGDKVQVISGRSKGKNAEVVKILMKKDRAVLDMESSDLKIGNRTLKRSQENPNGALVPRSFSVHVSNVKKIEEKD
jgi:large subunit ribosomal protein L24